MSLLVGLDEVTVETEKVNAIIRQWLINVINDYGYVHLYNIDGDVPVKKLDATSVVANFCGLYASVEINWSFVSDICIISGLGVIDFEERITNSAIYNRAEGCPHQLFQLGWV